MSSIGLIELVIVVAVIGTIAVVIGLSLARGLSRFRLGHATLDCPHCHKETPVTSGKCRHCGKEFA